MTLWWTTRWNFDQNYLFLWVFFSLPCCTGCSRIIWYKFNLIYAGPEKILFFKKLGLTKVDDLRYFFWNINKKMRLLQNLGRIFTLLRYMFDFLFHTYIHIWVKLFLICLTGKCLFMFKNFFIYLTPFV